MTDQREETARDRDWEPEVWELIGPRIERAADQPVPYELTEAGAAEAARLSADREAGS